MGRKKIQIRLIKNQRLRNITYNKRKKGLLKKIVELTKLCGIKAKLQLNDIFGNIIVLESGSSDIQNIKQEIGKQQCFKFSDQDYPQFKGFEKIRKKKENGKNDETQEQQKGVYNGYLIQRQMVKLEKECVKQQEYEMRQDMNDNNGVGCRSFKDRNEYLRYMNEQMNRNRMEYINLMNMNLMNLMRI